MLFTKHANQFGKKFLSLSVACAGLLMHGMSAGRRPIWVLRGRPLVALCDGPVQAQTLLKTSFQHSERKYNPIGEVSGGNTRLPDCYNISRVPAAREEITMELSGDNQTQQATVFPPVWVYVS